MILCQAMADRMPEVAAGGRLWTELEAQHLAGCPSCQEEWRLVRAATALGESAAQAVDPAKVTRAVMGRLRTRRRWVRTGWLGGLAAAAAVILMVSVGRQPAPPAVVATEPFRIPVAELDSLDSAQLETVLEDLDAPLESGRLEGVPPLGDLNDVQLERVLRSLEG